MTERIAIIGAGPAGLAASTEAVRQGMEVTLFERGRVGEGIRCAEGLFDPLQALDPPEVGVRYKVKSLCLRVEKQYELSTEGLRLWIIDRRQWQRHLAEGLRRQGVRIREGQAISRRNYAWLGGEFDWVIDASGVPSATSLVYGFRDFYLNHSLVTAHYVLADNFSHLEGKIKVGFSPDYMGYYWVFPKSKDRASVGIAFLPEDYGPRDLNLLWPGLHREIAAEGLSAAPVIERGGGLCPAKLPPRLVWGNVILAGDAAGLTSPLHGGGVDMALLSGREAVGAIARGEVSGYRERLVGLLGPRLQLEERLAHIWAGSSFPEKERLVAGLHNFFQGKGIGPLLPLSRDLLQKAYCLFQYWRGLHRGFR